MCYGQLLSTKIRTARRINKHKCWWCSEPILPGEKYEDQRILDGGIKVVVTHEECLVGFMSLPETEDGCYYHEGDGVRGQALYRWQKEGDAVAG